MKAIKRLTQPARKDVNLLGLLKWRKAFFWRWEMAKHRFPTWAQWPVGNFHSPHQADI